MRLEEAPAGAAATGEGLVVRGLHKRFGEVVALDGVDLSVHPGQLVGFLGPNGAGKTTTMRAILRLLSVDAGSITWEGRPISEEQRRRIGYMPQERGLYTRMRIHEHVAYMGRLAGLGAADANAAADNWIEQVGLADRRDDLIETLSGGNQQRVQLAVALVNDPALLILDEPFGGLDPVAAATLQDILTARAANGAGVVFSSHQLDLVQDLCEDVTIIADGVTVAAGTVRELRSRATRRIVEISWADPGVRWTPPAGRWADTDAGTTAIVPTTGRTDTAATTSGVDRSSAAELQSGPGWMRFDVPAGADPAEIVSAAAAAGRVATFSIEPPPLEAVFVELVAGEHTPLGEYPSPAGRLRLPTSEERADRA